MNQCLRETDVVDSGDDEVPVTQQELRSIIGNDFDFHSLRNSDVDPEFDLLQRRDDADDEMSEFDEDGSPTTTDASTTTDGPLVDQRCGRTFV